MKKLLSNIYQSDIPGAEYSECVEGGASDCASIHVRNLSLSFGRSEILRNISLSINPCSVTALVGPSGCGKTSFLQCLNRLTDLIPGATVSGQVQLGKTDLLNENCDVIALRRRVGMIFQKPSPFPFSIRQNFHLALREHGVSDYRQRDSIMERALRDVGLWSEVQDRLQQSATNLSGGQQQRLCIARAIALGPEILLFDEPCSALDPISSGIVEDLMCSLRGRYTVIVVTHNLAQARRIADTIAFFWLQNGAGALIEHGSVAQLFEAPQHELTSAYMSGARG